MPRRVGGGRTAPVPPRGEEAGGGGLSSGWARAAPLPPAMPAPPPCPKRCLRLRLLRALLGGLAALSALAFLAAGGHEGLLSLALPALMRLGGGGRDDDPRPALPAAPFSLAMSPPPCASPPPLLLVLVASAPGHAERRAAVRRSWGGAREAAGRPVRTVFALGLPGDGALQAALEREAAEHGDLLQARFADTYRNLTLKTLALLAWAAGRCPAARFVVKADDDVFLNLPGLAARLQALLPDDDAPPAPAYLGRVHWRVGTERDPRSRHFVPASLYPEPAYPPYCSGTTYVLSSTAVAAVLAAARHLPPIPVEDAFVGTCARRAGIAPHHLARVDDEARFLADGCCYREVLFSGHGVGPGEMLAVWAAGERPCAPWQRLLGLARCKVLYWLARLG